MIELDPWLHRDAPTFCTKCGHYSAQPYFVMVYHRENEDWKAATIPSQWRCTRARCGYIGDVKDD